jgi:AcrR family transcriptional regulator
MARPQTDIEAGREQLLDIVETMIEERGNAGFTVTELAARVGMSPASLYRYFESKEAVIEAVAERWFRPKVAIMDEVVASDLPPRRKMYEFYARRFAEIRAMWERDPVTFATYCELAEEHFEQVRSYIDLGDHYLGEIIAEAMADGHFAGLEVDEAISLINQMTSLYTNIGVMQNVMPRLSAAKLARIIDAVFDGLSAVDRGAAAITGLRAA